MIQVVGAILPVLGTASMMLAAKLQKEVDLLFVEVLQKEVDL